MTSKPEAWSPTCGIVIDLAESKREGFAEGYATFVDSEAEDSDIGALERAAT